MSDTAPQSTSSTKAERGHIYEGGQHDWQSYLSIRPDYRASNFYDEIWSYHSAKFESSSSSSDGPNAQGDGKTGWSSAFDIGTGPGNVAEVLPTRFSRVVASDISPDYVKQAESRLGPQFNKDPDHPRVSFEVCRAEEITRLCDPGSVDLVTAAECMSMIPTEPALAAFAQVLRPGGTLAIWFHGGPLYFSSSGVAGGKQDETVTVDHDDITALQRKITALSLEQFRPLAAGTIWEGVLTKIQNWFDNVGFAPEHWRDVTRVKWNTDRPLAFIDEDVADFAIPTVSSIRADEEVLKDKGGQRTFWIKEGVDYKFAEAFVDVLVPHFKEWRTDETSALLAEMEKLMSAAGGEDGGPRQVNASFPCVLILATKK